MDKKTANKDYQMPLLLTEGIFYYNCCHSYRSKPGQVFIYPNMW